MIFYMPLIERYVTKNWGIKTTAFGPLNLYDIFDTFALNFIARREYTKMHVEELCIPLNIEFNHYNQSLLEYINDFTY